MPTVALSKPHEGWNCSELSPVLALLELPSLLTRSSSNPPSYEGCVTDGLLRLSFHEDRGVLIVISNTNDQILSQTICTAWGEAESEKHWFPFQPICDQFEDEVLPSELNVTEMQDRLRTLVGATEVWTSDKDEKACNQTTVAIINHMKRASRTREPWGICCASPIIIRLDESDFDLNIDTICPVLEGVEESVVLTVQEQQIREVSLRPGVISFDRNRRPYNPRNRLVAEAGLSKLGVNIEMLAEINMLAGEIESDADC